MKTNQKLKNLPLSQILDLLNGPTKGNGEQEKISGGGITAAELANLQPDGETGRLVDALEKRAYFLLVRKVRVALLQALPGAILALGGLSEAPASEGEALARVPLRGIVEPQGPSTHIPLLVKQAKDALTIELSKLLPSAELMKQKRESAIALFTLAKDLGVFDLAKAYKEGSEGEDMEARIRAREIELGLDGLDE